MAAADLWQYYNMMDEDPPGYSQSWLLPYATCTLRVLVTYCFQKQIRKETKISERAACTAGSKRHSDHRNRLVHALPVPPHPVCSVGETFLIIWMSQVIKERGYDGTPNNALKAAAELVFYPCFLSTRVVLQSPTLPLGEQQAMWKHLSMFWQYLHFLSEWQCCFVPLEGLGQGR